MSDLRERLEVKRTALQPAPGGFERLVRRRHRREVRRQVEAGGLVVIIMLAGALAVLSVFRGSTHSIPITPINVHGLGAVWTGAVDGAPSDPTIADGTVYVSADRLYAFPLSCAPGSEPCAPKWTADIGSASTSRPVVADGVVLAVSAAGISAFDAACGGPVCAPLWTASSPSVEGLPTLDAHAPARYGAFSLPAVSDGFVFAAGGEGLYAFPLRCRDDGGECDPAWIGVGYGSDERPAVGERVIYVGGHGMGGLEAYPRSCPTLRCDRLWLLGPSVPSTFLSSVTAVGGDVYVNNGRYEGGVSPTSVEPTWVAKLDRSSSRDLDARTFSHVAVDGGVAYLTTSRLYAFPVACDDVCLPMWKGPRQYDQQIAQYRVWSDPVVANGLVFASTDRPYAFAVGCGTGGQVCEPLWIGPEGFASKPAVSDTAVAVTYADGRVVVFEPTAS